MFVTSEVVVVIIALLFIALWFLLLVHIAEVPGQLQVYAWVTPVLLVSQECVALGVVLPFSGVEHVAPVQGQCKGLVEEGLAQSEVE